jgi:hypothetical protein
MSTTFVFVLTVVLVLAIGWERRRRRDFAEDGATFVCRIRACGRSPVGWRRLRRRWSRWVWARWSGPELVIRRGPFLDRTLRLTGQITPEGVYLLSVAERRRCGPEPIAVRLRTADDSVIEMTATESVRAELVGPFVAAAFSDLPRAPVRRRRY